MTRQSHPTTRTPRPAPFTPPELAQEPHDGPAPSRRVTRHRRGCVEPGWTVERSRAATAVTIARCRGCGAVELRRESDR
jgi:hypothetical protein